MTNSMYPVVEDILTRNGHDPTRLMMILREVQAVFGWVSPETITQIAAAVNRPRAAVQSTVEFYSFFNAEPVGHYRVLFSDNITDRMLGSLARRDQLCAAFGVEPGQVSRDGLVSVDRTSCTGLCDQGPAVLVNSRAMPRVTADRIEAMVPLIRDRRPVAEWPGDWFDVQENIRRRDKLLGHGLAPGVPIKAALDRGPEGVLTELSRAALRGRGGGGFGTETKWRICRDAPGYAHYVVANADEGEPGTFKDRVLLASCPDLVFDGLVIAGLVTGARKGMVYLRGEYAFLYPRLTELLAQRRRAGLLGNNIMGVGFTFDIEVHLGAGAYICGEESALIESLEGKPGKPRIRPPYPVTQGFLGQPTAVNNVETLALAALITTHGGDWLKDRGTPTSVGTTLLSVSGDVERPGIYEYPYGVRIAEVLDAAGATDTQAVQIAVGAGKCLVDTEFDRRIAMEDASTTGSFMVFDRTRDLFEVAANFVEFFAHESCGFCTACRVGTTVNKRLMDKIAAGQGSPQDIEEMQRMHRHMQGASHCGLGSTATMALRDILNKFRPAFERRLLSTDFEPAFDLDAALSQARDLTGRDDALAHLEPAHARR